MSKRGSKYTESDPVFDRKRADSEQSSGESDVIIDEYTPCIFVYITAICRIAGMVVVIVLWLVTSMLFKDVDRYEGAPWYSLVITLLVSFFEATWLINKCVSGCIDPESCCCTFWRFLVWIDEWRKTILYVALAIPCFVVHIAFIPTMTAGAFLFVMAGLYMTKSFRKSHCVKRTRRTDATVQTATPKTNLVPTEVQVGQERSPSYASTHTKTSAVQPQDSDIVRGPRPRTSRYAKDSDSPVSPRKEYRKSESEELYDKRTGPGTPEHYKKERDRDYDREYRRDRRYSPDRDRRYSPDRHRDRRYSPDRDRRYSPDRDRRYSPERRRDYERDREYGRDREYKRDLEYDRDRKYDRDVESGRDRGYPRDRDYDRERRYEGDREYRDRRGDHRDAGSDPEYRKSRDQPAEVLYDVEPHGDNGKLRAQRSADISKPEARTKDKEAKKSPEPPPLKELPPQASEALKKSAAASLVKNVSAGSPVHTATGSRPTGMPSKIEQKAATMTNPYEKDSKNPFEDDDDYFD